MPIPVLRARTAAVLGVVLTTLLSTSVAEAKSIPAELRVVDSNGDVLAEQTQYTGTSETEVETDPKADCFGPDTGGSGQPAAVPGSTALSQLLDAAASDRDVKPISVSDSFDFGLAICGIGPAVSPQTGFLYLKQNHVGAQTGGDQTVLKKGDEVLWFLVEDFNDPLPDELVLSAPATAKAGKAVTVKVVAYGDDGKKKPAVGAKVSGASELTDSRGKTTVEVAAGNGTFPVSATLDGAIPSNEEVLCTASLAKCTPGYAATIGGTGGDDKIATGELAETILAGAGDDKIVSKGSSGSAPDLIKCGGGDDTVTLARVSPNKLVGCEKLRGANRRR